MINPNRVRRIKKIIYGFLVLVLLLPVVLTIVLYVRMGRMMKELREMNNGGVSIVQTGDSASGEAPEDILQHSSTSSPDNSPVVSSQPEGSLTIWPDQAPIDSGISSDAGVGGQGVSPKPVDIAANLYTPATHTALYFDTLVTPGSPPQNKTIYLTFDNTPSTTSDRLLEILDKHGVKATFFVWWSESNLIDNVAYYKKLVESGHSIGIHSYSCKEPFTEMYASKDAFLSDYTRIADAIDLATGMRTRFYRLPGGSVNPKQPQRQQLLQELKTELDSRGFLQYDWTTSAQDAVVPTLSKQRILDNIYPSLDRSDINVVLMHDGTGSTSTAEALDTLIEDYKAKGYAFLPITEVSAPVSFLENEKKEVVQ